MSSSQINHTTNSHNTQYSHNTNAFNNGNIVCNVNIGATGERSEILAWLSPLEPRTRHQDVRTHRADNVGNGCCERVNFEGGATALNMRDLIMRFYFATVVQALARPI